MSLRFAPVAWVVLLSVGLWAEAALAAPGDAVIPAHRTRNGAYVPASVPPMTAGTRLAPRSGKGSAAHAQDRATETTLIVPLFAEARSIRR